MKPSVADALDDVLVAAEDWLVEIMLAAPHRHPAKKKRTALVVAIDELMSAIELSERERPGRQMQGDGGEP
jgi:hypothetical protein